VAVSCGRALAAARDVGRGPRLADLESSDGQTESYHNLSYLHIWAGSPRVRLGPEVQTKCKQLSAVPGADREALAMVACGYPPTGGQFVVAPPAPSRTGCASPRKRFPRVAEVTKQPICSDF
jgi:hypothetical protein